MAQKQTEPQHQHIKKVVPISSRENIPGTTQAVKPRSRSLVDINKENLSKRQQASPAASVRTPAVAHSGVKAATDVNSAAENIGVPIAVVEAILDAKRAKPTGQSTHPVLVSAGSTEMNVLVSKPSTFVAKPVPAVTKIAPKTGTGGKPAQRSLLIPRTHSNVTPLGDAEQSHSLLTVTIPANTPTSVSSAPSAREGSNSPLKIQNPKQVADSPKVMAALISPDGIVTKASDGRITRDVQRAVKSGSETSVNAVPFLRNVVPLTTAGVSVIHRESISKMSTTQDVTDRQLEFKVEPQSARASPTGSGTIVISGVHSESKEIQKLPVINLSSSGEVRKSTAQADGCKDDLKSMDLPTKASANSETPMVDSSTKPPNVGASTSPKRECTDVPGTQAENTHEGVEEEGAEETGQCCDDQDCGVTVMPGNVNENDYLIFTRKHLSRMLTARFGGNHEMPVLWVGIW